MFSTLPKFLSNSIFFTEPIPFISSNFDFVIDFYVNGVVGLISQWLDLGMPSETTASDTRERFMRLLDGSIENMLGRFETKR